MLKIHKFNNRGDTLIEVLFAVSVFSLVAVGTLSIMNQGAATAQRALEITLVRNQMDAQAETLRFLNASYISAYQSGAAFSPDTPAGQWQRILGSTIDIPSTQDDTACPTTFNSKNFILNTHSAKFVANGGENMIPAKTFSQVNYTSDNATPPNYTFNKSEGIWIEAVRPTITGANQNNADYIDFYIRACWDSPGQSIPVTLGTIVRLYEPRG